jgi:16S rRNA (guanine527-N7)-methyltransferase
VGFALALEQVARPPATVVDLGSGGGLPALVLALRWSDSRWRLVEANTRRARFLDGAVRDLGMGERVEVLVDRAEEIARDPARRGGADLVTARGFGPPAVTAECGAPFLTVGGRLVVSEPPDPPSADAARWPASGLAELGLAPDGAVAVGEPPRHFQRLRQVEPCPDRYPRRTGVPAKRPLF